MQIFSVESESGNDVPNSIEYHQRDSDGSVTRQKLNKTHRNRI